MTEMAVFNVADNLYTRLNTLKIIANTCKRVSTGVTFGRTDKDSPHIFSTGSGDSHMSCSKPCRKLPISLKEDVPYSGGLGNQFPLT